MISLGNNITTSGDILQRVELKTICDMVRNPSPDIQARIRQLRLLRGIDEKQYGVAKRSLPYIVCGMFATGIRKSEDFSYTEYFIIDIDHISDKSMDIEQVHAKIVADERVAACFVSPGGDGLKVFFRFRERCYDKGLYSRFYKIFAQKFAQQNEIIQVVDMKTCDVTRACFLSHDPNVYFNPVSETIKLEDYVDTVDVYAQNSLLKEVENVIASMQNTQESEMKEEKSSPEKEEMDKIRATLNPELAKKKDNRQPAYVPEILNDIIGGLKSHIEMKGILVKEIKDIQYGKKLTMALGLRLAEINIFYGKKGFSVVKTPKTGTDAELNDLMADIVNEYINSMYVFDLPIVPASHNNELTLPS